MSTSTEPVPTARSLFRIAGIVSIAGHNWIVDAAAFHRAAYRLSGARRTARALNPVYDYRCAVRDAVAAAAVVLGFENTKEIG